MGTLCSPHSTPTLVSAKRATNAPPCCRNPGGEAPCLEGSRGARSPWLSRSIRGPADIARNKSGLFRGPCLGPERLFLVRQAKSDSTHIEIANQEAKVSTSTVEKSGLWIS